ncbi:transposase [Thomasclavelia cocleata]|uniref:transposase n=1 Tax=Thomasclavelia cocleata TaxID=69824 RepID=UPI003EB804F6
MYKKGIHLVIKQKKNEKRKGILKFYDKIFLRKRTVIESVNDFLKNICQIEHLRHSHRIMQSHVVFYNHFCYMTLVC